VVSLALLLMPIPRRSASTRTSPSSEPERSSESEVTHDHNALPSPPLLRVVAPASEEMATLRFGDYYSTLSACPPSRTPAGHAWAFTYDDCSICADRRYFVPESLIKLISPIRVNINGSNGRYVHATHYGRVLVCCSEYGLSMEFLCLLVDRHVPNVLGLHFMHDSIKECALGCLNLNFPLADGRTCSVTIPLDDYEMAYFLPCDPPVCSSTSSLAVPVSKRPDVPVTLTPVSVSSPAEAFMPVPAHGDCTSACRGVSSDKLRRDKFVSPPCVSSVPGCPSAAFRAVCVDARCSMDSVVQASVAPALSGAMSSAPLAAMPLLGAVSPRECVDVGCSGRTCPKQSPVSSPILRSLSDGVVPCPSPSRVRSVCLPRERCPSPSHVSVCNMSQARAQPMCVQNARGEFQGQDCSSQVNTCVQCSDQESAVDLSFGPEITSPRANAAIASSIIPCVSSAPRVQPKQVPHLADDMATVITRPVFGGDCLATHLRFTSVIVLSTPLPVDSFSGKVLPMPMLPQANAALKHTLSLSSCSSHDLFDSAFDAMFRAAVTRIFLLICLLLLSLLRCLSSSFGRSTRFSQSIDRNVSPSEVFASFCRRSLPYG